MVAGKYLASKVYLVTKTSLGSCNQLELGVREGDVLGVIQQKDPLGNRARWFCDNGAAKGFVSADCLVQQPSEVEEERYRGEVQDRGGQVYHQQDIKVQYAFYRKKVFQNLPQTSHFPRNGDC